MERLGPRTYSESETRMFFEERLELMLEKLNPTINQSIGREQSYHATLLAFFSANSNAWLESYEIPRSLRDIFDEVVLGRMIPRDPLALEIRGGLVLLFSGFFSRQLAPKDPQPDYMAKIGQLYFITAADHRTIVTDPTMAAKRAGMKGTARHFRLWQKIYAQLSIDLEIERYHFDFRPPSAASTLIQ